MSGAEMRVASEFGGFGAVVRVAVGDLRVGESPRLSGLDKDHIESLAAAMATLEPILVRPQTMTVVDGLHRLALAKLRNETHIAARFFFGSEQECFAEAVRANIAHGKPLTMAERRAACARLVATHGDWSDRALGELCGLSASTVAALRKHTVSPSGEQSRQPVVRIGRDGRARPVSTAGARVAAAELLGGTSDGSIRQIARAVGTSVATVRDVRDRVNRGESPLPPRLVPKVATPGSAERPPDAEHTYTPIRLDSAFAGTRITVRFATWFDRHLVRPDDWRPFVDELPLSRLFGLADEARVRAAAWEQLASCLEQRTRGSTQPK